MQMQISMAVEIEWLKPVWYDRAADSAPNIMKGCVTVLDSFEIDHWWSVDIVVPFNLLQCWWQFRLGTYGTRFYVKSSGSCILKI